MAVLLDFPKISKDVYKNKSFHWILTKMKRNV